MSEFPINGVNLPISVLLAPGERVSRQAIEAGQMFEVEVNINDEVFYLPLWTPLGVAALFEALGEEQ